MFGVAMTLLLTTLILRAQTLTGSALQMLHDISGGLFIVALSFAISGTYWVLHQRQLAMSRSVTARQTLPHFVFLFLIVLLPISTALLGGRGATQSVVIVYGAHLALISLLNLLLWLEVRRSAGVGERIAGSFLTLVLFVAPVAVGAVRPELAQYFWYAAFAMPWLGRRLTRKFSKSPATASDS
jgi:uncharacterized membrane protein